jgi:hypothetical protein
MGLFEWIRAKPKASDTLYLNVNVANDRYLLEGSGKTCEVNGLVLTSLLLIGKQAGWAGGNQLFDGAGVALRKVRLPTVLNAEETASLAGILRVAMIKHAGPQVPAGEEVMEVLNLLSLGRVEIKKLGAIGTSGSRRSDYRKIVRAIAKDVLQVDLQAAGGFNNAKLNTREVRHFLAWAVARSFVALKDKSKMVKAGQLATDEILSGLAADHNARDELDKEFHSRWQEYSGLLIAQAGEEPSAALLRTCRRAAQYVTSETDPHIAKIMAISTWWWPAVTSYPKILVEMDQAGEIEWDPRDN